MPFALNHFDQIIYINLSYRKDRKKSINQEFRRLKTDQKKIHRIEAHYDPLNGHRGCAISHIRALEYAQKYKNALILEDDCVFAEKPHSVNYHIRSFFQSVKSWDVFFLTNNLYFFSKTQWKDIYRILFATGAAAYGVNSHYIPTLLKCYRESLEKMKNDLFFVHSAKNCIDQCWLKLQLKDKWYMKKQMIAYHKGFFSDISQMTVSPDYYLEKIKTSKILEIGSYQNNRVYGLKYF